MKMIELPESITLADQIDTKFQGKKLIRIIPAFTPHKLAWYYGDPKKYEPLLAGKVITRTKSVGGIIEISADNATLLFSDGVGLRVYSDSNKLPPKHQLLIEFDDSTYLVASIRMYGGIVCFTDGVYENKYYSLAKQKPSPLSQHFNKEYFNTIISIPELQNKSAKFFLATEQRIPGLGNGVLQDILFAAKIHPKRKISSLSSKEKCGLFHAIKSVLKEMVRNGGRDTEKDLYGNSGGYKTKLCKNTVGRPCPVCSTVIEKSSYLGGSIYFCINCQKMM
jgi:formamidopyrimidine-DNA glycosylase